MKLQRLHDILKANNLKIDVDRITSGNPAQGAFHEYEIIGQPGDLYKARQVIAEERPGISFQMVKRINNPEHGKYGHVYLEVSVFWVEPNEQAN